ncbi:Retrotransposon protein [Cocos nucifera]|uniref:Retrotransposon protein n=1 Tax=Cocos nucifera TaxID=13894 RepID=A0A8K0MZ84_COCNU|nr:Retrotransposon protein [Cocos nucifera]
MPMDLCKNIARLVVKGYAQVPGIDFFETFSPVARIDTIRTILAVAAQNGWQVFQLDVQSAFLNGDLEEVVYVRRSEGFEIKGKKEKVYRLEKVLYDLKQAPRAWYSKINNHFIKNGFECSKNEPTLYKKCQGMTEILIVCIYVDDMIFTGNSISMMESFKVDMMSTFAMTDLGKMKYFLGMEVVQSSFGIFLSQEKYAIDLLEKFHMLNCKPAKTPMNSNDKLMVEDGSDKADEKVFRSMVGGLIFLTHTRPDIMFAVSLISRFMHSPSNHHFGAAKRVLRYVAGTTSLGIMYSKVNDFKLLSFTDSSWADCADDRKSTTGYCFSFGSGLISWCSKKRPTIALSSIEAEHIACTVAACQAVWLRRILSDLKKKQAAATPLICDNKSAIVLANNPIFHGRSKHIEVRCHFIGELV